MNDNELKQFFEEYGDDLVIGLVAFASALVTGGASIALASAIGVGAAGAASFDDYIDSMALDEGMQAALAQVIPYLVAINQTLQDGFAGKYVVAGQLERQVEALRDGALTLYGRMQELAEENGELDNDKIWENLATPWRIPTTPTTTEIKPMAEQFSQMSGMLLALQERLDARRAELAVEGAATPAEASRMSPLTPEELDAAYAPSAEMRARIDAVNESFGRLADPLLPELEARIESLCDVLEECASCACAEGRAEDMGIVMGPDMGADMKAAQPGIAPLAKGEVRSNLEFRLAA